MSCFVGLKLRSERLSKHAATREASQPRNQQKCLFERRRYLFGITTGRSDHLGAPWPMPPVWHSNFQHRLARIGDEMKTEFSGKAEYHPTIPDDLPLLHAARSPFQPMAMSSAVVVPPDATAALTQVPPYARTILLSFMGFLRPSSLLSIGCHRLSTVYLLNVQRYGHGTLSEVFACNVCLPALLTEKQRLTMGGYRLHARRRAHTPHTVAE